MPAAVKPDEVRLARQVIGTFEGELDFAAYRDEYQDGLREIIDAKIEGREVVAPEVEAPPKVVNLMDALRKSLDTHQRHEARKPAPVRAEGRRNARKRARGVTRSIQQVGSSGSNLLDNQGFLDFSVI